QQSLEKDIDQLKKERQAMQRNSPPESSENQRLMDKQEQLERMFEDLMSDEMKELYRKLEEMMEQMDRNQLLEQMEEMEFGAEEHEKAMDRSLEILKTLGYEQKYMETMDKHEELAEQQEELADKTVCGNADSEGLKEEQDAL